jgi:hypothetical protein
LALLLKSGEPLGSLNKDFKSVALEIAEDPYKQLRRIFPLFHAHAGIHHAGNLLKQMGVRKQVRLTGLICERLRKAGKCDLDCVLRLVAKERDESWDSSNFDELGLKWFKLRSEADVDVAHYGIDLDELGRVRNLDGLVELTDHSLGCLVDTHKRKIESLSSCTRYRCIRTYRVIFVNFQCCLKQSLTWWMLGNTDSFGLVQS